MILHFSHMGFTDGLTFIVETSYECLMAPAGAGARPLGRRSFTSWQGGAACGGPTRPAPPVWEACASGGGGHPFSRGAGRGRITCFSR